MTYISSLSISNPLRSSILQTQTALSNAQTELSTGTQADLGTFLGSRTGSSLSLKAEIDQLTTYSTANGLASTRLSGTSSILNSMLTSAQSMAATLTTAASGATAELPSTSQEALQSFLGMINNSTGSQFIFGGINTTTKPLTDYSSTSAAKSSVDNAFQAAFGTSQTSAGASAITGAQMQSFLSNQFATLFNDSNWSANWSSASNTTITSQTGPAQSVTTSVSANDTAFRQLAEAYTMVSEFSGSNMSVGARAAVISTASSLVSGAIDGLTNLSSSVGDAQNVLSTSDTQITDQVTFLKGSVSNLDDVDTYSLSTQITQLQTQLQASYELTSKLSTLSLVNYLPPA